jgi:hypothetical protein
LRDHVESNDVLYPYSSIYLAALPETGEARGLPRAQAQSLLAALERVDYPSGDLYVAVPAGKTPRRVPPEPIRGLADFGSWILIRKDGPFADRRAVLLAAEEALGDGRRRLATPFPQPLAGWFELNRAVICETLAKIGSQCGTE